MSTPPGKVRVTVEIILGSGARLRVSPAEAAALTPETLGTDSADFAAVMRALRPLRTTRGNQDSAAQSPETDAIERDDTEVQFDEKGRAP